MEAEYRGMEAEGRILSLIPKLYKEILSKGKKKSKSTIAATTPPYPHSKKKKRQKPLKVLWWLGLGL